LYIRFKHALSELTLEAVATLDNARCTAWLAAYAETASAGEAVPMAAVRSRARQLAAPAGWRLDPTDLRPATRRHILWRGGDRMALPRAHRPYWGYFASQARRLYRAVLHLHRRPLHERLPDVLYRGLVLLDCGLFFSGHEYFEGVWRRTQGPDRLFYHGFIQVGAAFYHHEKGNRHGAVTLLRRALAKLSPYRPRHLGLGVGALLETLQPWQRRFAHGESSSYPVFVIHSRPSTLNSQLETEGP
jgi:predicted metal-dependent hydrolase